jgi:hypothetical protein
MGIAIEKGEQVTISLGGGQLTLGAETVAELWLNKLMNKSTVVHPSDVPKLGEYWPGQGGVRAAVMRGQDGHPDYHLVVIKAISMKETTWGARGVEVAGARSPWDGLANYKAMLESIKAGNSHPVAAFIQEMESEGHRDLYLPARHELRAIWVNCPDLLPPGWCLSSTEYSAYYAYGQSSDGGTQYYFFKGNTGRAFAVRRVLIL